MKQKQQRVLANQKNLGNNKNNNNDDDDAGSIPTDFSMESILESIDVFRVHDETALLATLYSLQHHIESAAALLAAEQQQQQSTQSLALPVKLIVVDSIAFHFRAVTPTDSSYYLQRTKTLASLASYLGDLAQQHDLAVVVINQMTTKINNNNVSNNVNNNNDAASLVVPALGESWAHATATRLILSKEEQLVASGTTGSEEEDDDHDREI